LGLCLLFLHSRDLSPARVLTFPQNLNEVYQGLASFRPQAVITLGLLLLILTPVIRVATSVVIFAYEKDGKYVVITTTVLAILLISFFLGNQQQEPVSTYRIVPFSFSLTISSLMFAGSVLAGLLGSLVGLGGGILIVPLLTLAFHIPIHFAIGVSIISVIATSSGAAVAYMKDRLTNLRVAMFLELATTVGAISGAFLATFLTPEPLAIIFGVVLLISLIPTIFKLGEEIPRNVRNDHWADVLDLASSYPDSHLGKEINYQVSHTPWGLGMMYVAGAISGLLGIGSGTFKVIAMDTLMRLPLKVSTTTSNLMIGVTAAASAGIYFLRGDIPPIMAAPIALGVLLGAFLGTRLLVRLSNKNLRLIFLPVIAVAAIEMILHGLKIGSF
jgi:uncharacterized membrane protein YfcA/uncharacterized membrane protein